MEATFNYTYFLSFADSKGIFWELWTNGGWNSFIEVRLFIENNNNNNNNNNTNTPFNTETFLINIECYKEEFFPWIKPYIATIMLGMEIISIFEERNNYSHGCHKDAYGWDRLIIMTATSRI